MHKVILTPFFGGIDKQHLECIGRLVKKGWEHIGVTDCALVDHARAELAARALASNGDVFLWIDHDIIFDDTEAEAIIHEAVNVEGIIAAPVILKKPGGKMMVRGLTGKVAFGERGRLYPCKGVPFGFTAMSRELLVDVCESVGPALGTGARVVYPAFSCLVIGGLYLSEDYSFCHRALQRDWSIYLDTRRRVAHKGSYLYTFEDGGYCVPTIDDYEVEMQNG